MHTYFLPVSIKGIVLEDDKVWLRKNERDEWELPGGKMEEHEHPKETVVRELKEELGFLTEVIDIITVEKYTVNENEDEKHGVLVVIYLCNCLEKVGGFELRGEGGKAHYKKFTQEELKNLNMRHFYKTAIHKAFSKSQ